MSNVLVNDTSRSLTDFRGGFDQLAELMQRSWSENHASSFLYSSSYLESCFQQPGASYTLAPTIYHGNDPVGFVAGFPRSIRYKERTWRILLITLLTVAPEHKKLGYGIILWSELVKRARESGFDGMMNYCVDGEPMNGMIVGCCDRMHLPVERVFTVNYLTSILWPKAADCQSSTKVDSSDCLLETCNSVSDLAELGRRWSAEEISWLRSREGTVVACHKEAQRSGALTGQIMSLTDESNTKALMVEDILWGTLEREERIILLKKLMALASAHGARIVTVPLLGYADMDPFRAARFRPSTRKLHAYFTLWRDPTSIEKVESFYLDVF